MRRILIGLLLCSTYLMAADMIGHRAPGFSLTDLNMKQHDPLDYRGKILIVEFMQTTCPHCAAFSKTLAKVVTKYAGKVAVLSIVNPPDTPQNVRSYVAAHGVNYPILFDCGQVAASYVRSASFDIPRIFIVDPSGIIRRDIQYSFTTHDIFEGQQLFTELDRMLAQYRMLAQSGGAGSSRRKR